ncbi:MAG: MaoC family dehydratase N-terminal domain-containing protein [Porticoccaceae bacterium]
MNTIDKSLIGMEFPAVHVTVDCGGVQAFAHSIGETDPVYFHRDVAIARGHGDIPAPPTYIFCLKTQIADPQHLYQDIGIDAGPGKLLHAEQSFEYYLPVCVSDQLTFKERIADIYEKKGGSLIFIVLETVVTNGKGQQVAKICHTEVLRADA